ncbi:MAG: protein kinase [Xanthomonadales bacterium]|nr:protein kinase [Xanthomonadales bacterium]
MTAPGTRDFVLEDGPATSTGVLAASEFSSGQIIAERYRVERLLGMGGMGVVYLAHDLQLDVPVALKLLRPELASRPDAFERFRQELLLARQVSSPHVVRIHDLVQHGAAWLISMDYVAGRSLESLLDERGTLDVDTALQITRQLALGLAAAHARGVVHRDLKPANILMTEQGDALITDFGVARSAGATGITVSGVVIGTPEYLSPEQAKAEKVDGRSDLYALGLILYEMLTGRVPFSGGTPAEMLAQRIVSNPPGADSVRKDLPSFVVRLCTHLLELRPAHRFQRAEDVVRAIDDRRAPRAPRAARPWWLALAAVSLLAVAWIGWQQPWRDQAPQESVRAPSADVAVWPVLVEGSDDPILQDVAAGLTAWMSMALIGDVDHPGTDDLRMRRALRELALDAGGARRQFQRLGTQLRVDAFIDVTLKVDGALHTLTVQQVDAGTGVATALKTIVIADASGWPAALQELAAVLRTALGWTADATVVDRADAGQLQRIGALLRADSPESIQQMLAGDDPGALAWTTAFDRLIRMGRENEAAVLARGYVEAHADATPIESAPRRLALWLQYLDDNLDAATQGAAEWIAAHPADAPVRLLGARAAMANGQLEQAAADLEQVVALDARNFDGWYLGGRIALMQGDAQRAVDEHFTRALIIANRQQDPWMIADAVNALGVGYMQLGQYQPAREHFERAVSLRTAQQDIRGESAALRNLATIQAIQGDFGGADASLTQARERLLQLGDPELLADLDNDRGVLAEEQGHFSAALDFYRSALAFRQQHDDAGRLGESLLNVAFAYYQLGEFDNALVYWQQADQTFRSGEDEVGALRAREGLALAHLARGEFAEVRETLEASVVTAEAKQLQEERAVALAGLAELERLEGHYRAAFARNDDAEAFFRQRDDQRGLSEMLLHRARTLLDVGLTDEADTLLRTVKPDSFGSREQQAGWWLLRAQAALAAGDAAQSLRYADEATTAAEEAGNRQQQLRASLLRALGLDAAGQHADARTLWQGLAPQLGAHVSIPTQLEASEAALRLGSDDAVERYRVARQQLARMTRYGRAWQLYAWAARRLPRGHDQSWASAEAARAFDSVRERVPERALPALRAEAQTLGLEPSP